jgi:hypothetical protein
MEAASVDDRHALDLPGLHRLIEVVREAGYRVAGPKVRDGALCYEELDPAETLPHGVRDEQRAGRYRLRTGEGADLFSQAVGPHSWKRFLSPPEQRLFTAKKDERGKAVQQDKHQPKPDDSEAVAQWRARMASDEAKEIYKQRAATAECVNAQARNRGLLRMPVRGLAKVRSVVGLFVLAHNLMRMAVLAPQLIGWGTGPSAMAASAA